MQEGRLGGGSDTWGTISVRAVSGLQAFRSYHLGIDFELTFLSAPPGSDVEWTGPLAVSAELWAGEGTNASPQYLGVLDFREPLFILPSSWQSGFPAHLATRIHLSAQQVESVEEVRSGRDLALRIDVQSVPFATSEPIPYQTQFFHEVSQSDWVKVLDQLGFQRKLLLEIPVPDRSEFSGMASVVDYLVEARAAITRGGVGYREAVGLCRDALESLRSTLDDSVQEVEAWRKRSQELAETMDKNERLLIVRRALWRLTSAAKHPTGDWDRKEATSILAMVSGIVRLAVTGDTRSQP